MGKKKGEIAVWGHHKFVVQPKVIQMFRDMTITGSCETEDKTSGYQKYVGYKNGQPTEISFTVDLNVLTGVKDVYGEAMVYVQEADEGAYDFLYLSGTKVLDIQLMLTKAEVSEIVLLPGYGNKWVSCSVKLTFKKCTTRFSGDGGSSGSGGDDSGSGSNGYTARVYYQLGSGASCYNVSAWSSISYADALKKAKAKVPQGATWIGTNPADAPAPSQPVVSGANNQDVRDQAQQGSGNIGLDGRLQNQNENRSTNQP